jgi:hypothetical protein
VSPSAGGSYNPETLQLLRGALDSAWESLTPDQRARTLKSDMALRILRLAQRGERNPAKLRMAALIGVVPTDGSARPPA